MVVIFSGSYYFFIYKNKKISYQENQEVFATPYKGFVPMIDSMPGYEKMGLTLPVNLVYVGITWAQLEPTAPGQINWSALEAGFEAQIKKSRMIGIRFKVADPWVGGDLDVPEWLVELGVGVGRYNIDGGTGMIPDWDSPIFQEHHKRIIMELGKRYNNHPHIAWVDIGSYGIWGEWHHYKNEHLKAKHEDSKRKIIDSYFAAFPNKLMAIPFDDDWARLEVIKRKQGLRNDCLGPKDSNNWFIESMETTIPGFWENLDATTLITGEFCGGDEGALKYLRENFHETIKFVQKTKWSFVGPAGGNLSITRDKDLVKAKEFYKQLGYHYFVKSLELNVQKKSAEIQLNGKLTIVNSGSSAFNLNWPLSFKLKDKLYPIAVDIRNVSHGAHEIPFSISVNKEDAGDNADRNLYLQIHDPNFPERKLIFANKEMVNSTLLLKEKIY